MNSNTLRKNSIDGYMLTILKKYESIDNFALYSLEKLATGGWWKIIWLKVVELYINLSTESAADRMEPNLFSAHRRNQYGKALNDKQFRTCQTMNKLVCIPHRLISVAVLKNHINEHGEFIIDIYAVRHRARIAFVELILLFCTCSLLITVLWSLLVLDATLFQIAQQLVVFGSLSTIGIACWLLASYQVFIYGIVPLALFKQLEENQSRFLSEGICYQLVDSHY